MPSNLILHSGGRVVSPDELNSIKAPPPKGRWFPLSHGSVLTRVKDALAEAGYVVRNERLGLSRKNHCFFGVLDLATPLAEGVSLAVGVRNSTDKSFSLGFCAGNRVLVCDNLAFRSELLVKRKHTRYGEQRFIQDVFQAVASLRDFKEMEEARIKAMQQTELTGDKADSLILNAFEKGIVSAPALPAVIKQWREPDYDEFKERTYWSLMNAFTFALRDVATSNPQRFSLLTMRLSHHLSRGEPQYATAT
jgi:hypothetical protein